MIVTEHANVDPVFEDWDDVQSEMAAIRKDLSAFHGKWVDQSSEKHSNPGLIACVLLSTLRLCCLFSYIAMKLYESSTPSTLSSQALTIV